VASDIFGSKCRHIQSVCRGALTDQAGRCLMNSFYRPADPYIVLCLWGHYSLSYGISDRFVSSPPQFSSFHSVLFHRIPISYIVQGDCIFLHVSFHLLHVYLTGIFRPKRPHKFIVGMLFLSLCNLTRSLEYFIRIFVEMGISLYMSCSSSWYPILHSSVGSNIFQRFLHSKESIFSRLA